MEPQESDASGVDYETLGLIGSPFDLDHKRRRFGIGPGIVMHAMLLETLADIATRAGEERPAPLRILRPAGVSASWHRRATASFLRLITENKSTGVLAMYIPMENFRLGRIRGVLAETAERVAYLEFPVILEAFAKKALAEPDTDLEEYGALCEHLDVDDLRTRLEGDPQILLGEVFGPPIVTRDPGADPRQFMHLSVLRTDRLHMDPVEDEASEEVDLDDPMGDAFMEPTEASGLDSLEGVVEGTEEIEIEDPLAEQRQIATAISDYLIAYMREHHSPVLARGLRAYRAQGIAAMAVEWRVTKAPKKTLRALVDFACLHYEKVCFIYERFETFAIMEDDVKSLILGTMSEIRFALGGSAITIILSTEGDAPELQEAFGGADRRDWDLRAIERFHNEETGWDVSDVQGWLDAAALSGREAPRVDSEPMGALMEAAEGDLDAFADMAAAALRSAAERGLSDLDAQAVETGRAATGEGAAEED